MKKFLYLFLLLAMAPQLLADPPEPDEDVLRPNIEGGGDLYVQLNLGINFTMLSGDPFYRTIDQFEQPASFFESGTGFGPLVGVGIGYQFTPMFGLQLRVDYDARQAGNSGDAIDTCVLARDLAGNPVVTSPVPVNKEWDISINYLSFSLLGDVRFGDFFLFLGPTFSLPLSQEISETNTILPDATNCYYYPGTADTVKRVSGTYTNADTIENRFSLKLGAGYVIELSPTISLVPQIGYDLGLYGVVAEGTYSGVQSLEMTGRAGQTEAPGINRINPLIKFSSLQASIGLRVNL